ALDANGNVITSYSSTSVTVTPSSGTLSMTTCAPLSSGVCTLTNVTLNSLPPIPTTQNAASVTLAASDNGSPALTGTGSITVYKPLDHFTITTTPTSVHQQVSAVTDSSTLFLSALDANGNVVTSYSSTSVTVTSSSGGLSATC